MDSTAILIINTAGGWGWECGGVGGELGGSLFFSASMQLFHCALTTHCLHSSNKLILLHVAVGVWVNSRGKIGWNHYSPYLCPHLFKLFPWDLYNTLTSEFILFTALLHCDPPPKHIVSVAVQMMYVHRDTAGGSHY